MQHCINVGVDLHDRTMVLRWALDRDEARAESFSNDEEGRQRMIRMFAGIRTRLGASRVLFAYEASCQGFGLYDRLTDAGFECAVLAPTRMVRSVKERSNKDDGRDAMRILDLLRAHVLAGCQLPAVWVPDRLTRDDRELVRARLDLSDKLVALKNQVRTLLKRNEVQTAGRAGGGLDEGLPGVAAGPEGAGQPSGCGRSARPRHSAGPAPDHRRTDGRAG